MANAKLYFWAYMMNGWVQTFGCFICFWVTFHDFGFPMKNTWFLNGILGIPPEDTDIYQPDSPNLGNSNLKPLLPCTPGKDYGEDEGEVIDWLYFNHAHKDLRMAYVECVVDNANGGLTRFITH